jgi:hypothetical protein
MQQPFTARFIVGIKQQLKFADFVNAMMVNPPSSSTETLPVPVAAKGEQVNVETTTTSVHLATNKDDSTIAKIV